MLGARRSYALAGLVLLGIASVSLLALRHPTLDASQSAAVFVGKDTLVRPEGYRGWIRASGPGRTVYMNPAGYREFSRTGRVPDGALLIWESVGADGATGPSHQAHQASSVLLASVKDSSRFDGGWAFFDFTSARGGLRSNAKALPEASGCGTCHRPDAETDGVLTEFHLVL
jgi:hypothetical protein